jgi:phenylacetate-CoA ligase
MASPRRALTDLVDFVRARSPFYRELYRGLPRRVERLSQLPIVDQKKYWSANARSSSRVLTGPARDGIVLRSGGTTGKPKFSVFSRDEWNEFTRDFARKLALGGLKDGDRVANLFYSGALYGSFLFTHKVLEECPVRTLQLPITGNAPCPEIVSLLSEYRASVVAALPTTLITMAERVLKGKLLLPRVRLVLFAGEPVQEDQRKMIRRAFPKAVIRSIGYASNDAGPLGYADLRCAPNEFRCYDGHSIYEIVDEKTGEPISEPGRAGVAVVTDLTRRLMPVIRYPVGDRALWREPQGVPNRRFLLLGRSEESARVASLSVGYDEIGKVLKAFHGRLGHARFQLVMEHRGGKDGLALRVAARIPEGRRAALARDLIAALYRSQSMLRRFVDEKKIHPVRLEWESAGGLEINPRTGKLRRIVDSRSS